MTRKGLFKITAIAASLCTVALAGASQFSAGEVANTDVAQHIAQADSVFDTRQPVDDQGYIWSQARWDEPE